MLALSERAHPLPKVIVLKYSGRGNEWLKVVLISPHVGTLWFRRLLARAAIMVWIFCEKFGALALPFVKQFDLPLRPNDHPYVVKTVCLALVTS